MTQNYNIQNGGRINTHQNEAHVIIKGPNRNAYITLTIRIWLQTWFHSRICSRTIWNWYLKQTNVSTSDLIPDSILPKCHNDVYY